MATSTYEAVERLLESGDYSADDLGSLLSSQPTGEKIRIAETYPNTPIPVSQNEIEELGLTDGSEHYELPVNHFSGNVPVRALHLQPRRCNA